MANDSQEFYKQVYKNDQYAKTVVPESHSFYPKLVQFLQEYHLDKYNCLEIGCGRGIFQDIAEKYIGVDISESAGVFFHKPFITASATSLPFPDNTFDAIWSHAVLEHIHNPEQALDEIRRIIKPGGKLLLAPAWQCRSWAADGYSVRPYSDFDIKGKIIKAFIPFRNSLIFRLVVLFPKRVVHLLFYLLRNRPLPLWNRVLKPNYEIFWTSDSDAVNSLDPFDVILWHVSRHDVCLSYPSLLKGFFVRTGALIFTIKNNNPIS